MTRLFDLYLMVDWSAANCPSTGKDSIWVAGRWAEGCPNPPLIENIPTRREALARIAGLLGGARQTGHRVLAGFDFAFGYPQGFAKRLGSRKGWTGVWSRLASMVEDDPTNRSNRFAVGEALNGLVGEPVFWGKPHQHGDLYPGLPAKRLETTLPTRRIVERHVPRAKSAFQLAYNGAVGSQALLGIAALEGLRRATGARVWPFETAFADDLPEAPLTVLAEVYPTLVVDRAPEGGIKDRAQVEALCSLVAERDREGSLAPLLAPPPGITPAERNVMLREEGSILGAGVL